MMKGILLVACTAFVVATSALAASTGINILVYSHTAGFNHKDAIKAGLEVLEEMASKEGWTITATVDPNAFTASNLKQYNVIIFNNTSQNVLPEPEQRAAFQAFIQGGGGFVGIHAASDTLYDWEWYGKLVGAYFRNHPRGMQTARIIVEDQEHPSMQGLGDSFDFHDEWYWFRSNPRDLGVKVLARLDRTSHQALINHSRGKPEEDHPIIWCHEYDGGRVWYTGLGHTTGPVKDERFAKMLHGGIIWAANK
jgi:type 1 glutamine amidotransferase